MNFAVFCRRDRLPWVLSSRIVSSSHRLDLCDMYRLHCWTICDMYITVLHYMWYVYDTVLCYMICMIQCCTICEIYMTQCCAICSAVWGVCPGVHISVEPTFRFLHMWYGNWLQFHKTQNLSLCVVHSWVVAKHHDNPPSTGIYLPLIFLAQKSLHG